MENFIHNINYSQTSRKMSKYRKKLSCTVKNEQQVVVVEDDT